MLEGRLGRTLLQLFKRSVIQFFLSLVTTSVRLEVDRVSGRKTLANFVKTGKSSEPLPTFGSYERDGN